MKRLLYIIPIFFINFCVSQECIQFNQSYVKFRDSGYRDLYFCNDKCDFFEEYYKEREKVHFYELSSETHLFLASLKLTNKSYYDELKKIVLKKIKKGIKNDGAIFVKLLDNNGKILKTGTIVKKDFESLKQDITYLNLKYNIDKNDILMIDWYFDTVRKGVFR